MVNVADESLPSVTVFASLALPEITRCTRTNFPANERFALALTVNVPRPPLRPTLLSVSTGRTLTVGDWLVAACHFASYAVWIVGEAVYVQFPPAVVSTVVSGWRAACPYG